MKTFITYTILLLLIAAMSSCVDRTKIKLQEDSPFGDVLMFEYKSHTYLKFGRGNWQTIAHNPDCSCLNKHIIPLDNDTQ